jgi:nucleoside phosphorylase
MSIISEIGSAFFGFSTASIEFSPSIKNDKPYYHILIASALNEELNPFLRLHRGKWSYLDKAKSLKTFKIKNSKQTEFNILTYSVDKMGLPVNGIALTDIIRKYQPRYVIYIGTCAGLHPTENNEGDVLIPEYVYAYDSGKYDDKGIFRVEHRHYDLSQTLRTMASDMIEKNSKYRFGIEQNCGFCSGASVVSNKTKRNQIIKGKNRKVAGFDMEAYSLAVINQFCDDVDTIVIKGIMDFGEKKDDKFKTKAKNNCARIANDLIIYMIEHIKNEL